MLISLVFYMFYLYNTVGKPEYIYNNGQNIFTTMVRI